jgi:hypothetical protein
MSAFDTAVYQFLSIPEIARDFISSGPVGTANFNRLGAELELQGVKDTEITYEKIWNAYWSCKAKNQLTLRAAPVEKIVYVESPESVVIREKEAARLAEEAQTKKNVDERNARSRKEGSYGDNSPNAPWRAEEKERIRKEGEENLRKAREALRFQAFRILMVALDQFQPGRQRDDERARIYKEYPEFKQIAKAVAVIPDFPSDEEARSLATAGRWIPFLQSQNLETLKDWNRKHASKLRTLDTINRQAVQSQL